MHDRPFRNMLTERQIQIDSVLCVGLDPVIDKIPPHLMALCTSVGTAVFLWMREIVDATAPCASMFKFQYSCWARIPDGLVYMRLLRDHIRMKHPEIVMVIDCKNGDIDRTQRHYGDTHLNWEGFDGMTYNGYMGSDTLEALVDPKRPGRALIGLGRTSNPNAWKFQDCRLENGPRVWEAMVREIVNWSIDFGVLENAGIVMGAAFQDPGENGVCVEHLTRARQIVGNELWMLIPGIGAQKGFVRSTVQAAFHGPGSIAVANSSQITFASMYENFADAAHAVAYNCMLEMRRGASCAKAA